jgi:hypothetical protein
MCSLYYLLDRASGRLGALILEFLVHTQSIREYLNWSCLPFTTKLLITVSPQNPSVGQGL